MPPPFFPLLHLHEPLLTLPNLATTPCPPVALAWLLLHFCPCMHALVHFFAHFMTSVTLLRPTIILLCPYVTLLLHFSIPYPYYDSVPLLDFWPFHPYRTLHLCPSSRPCSPPVGIAVHCLSDWPDTHVNACAYNGEIGRQLRMRTGEEQADLSSGISEEVQWQSAS